MSKLSVIRVPSRSRLREGGRDAGGPAGLPWRGQEGPAVLGGCEKEIAKNEDFRRARKKMLDPRAEK